MRIIVDGWRIDIGVSGEMSQHLNLQVTADGDSGDYIAVIPIAESRRADVVNVQFTNRELFDLAFRPSLPSQGA